MIEIGRVCVKISGRDAGKRGVVIDVLDEKYVVLDGEVRRKKCNTQHLEPTKTKIAIEKDAPHETILKEFEKLGIKIREKRPKKKIVNADSKKNKA